METLLFTKNQISTAPPECINKPMSAYEGVNEDVKKDLHDLRVFADHMMRKYQDQSNKVATQKSEIERLSSRLENRLGQVEALHDVIENLIREVKA